MKKELLENLTSCKNQLTYVNERLNSNLENWERKEYLSVKTELIADIESLEYRISIY